MLLKYLRMYNFRNYNNFELHSNPNITVIYGKNGSGKTNILEAVHFSCFARSQRTRQDKDLIRIGENEAAVAVETIRNDGNHSVNIQLQGISKLQKTPFVHGKRVDRISEIFGHCSCVLFAPEDTGLIKGGPQERRRFADMQISQIDRVYLNQLSMYINAMRNRNALLKIKKDRQESFNDPHIDIWEDIMSREGLRITESREKFFEELNSLVGSIYQNLSVNNGERLKIEYISSIRRSSDNYSLILRQSRINDMKRGGAYIGPHKDDLYFYLNGNDMRDYASQGQIRTAVLAVKLAMIQIIDRTMGEKPILLLDDVFSELDTRRRAALMEYISNIQSFITCTDKSDLQLAKANSYLHVVNNEGIADVYEE